MASLNGHHPRAAADSIASVVVPSSSSRRRHSWGRPPVDWNTARTRSRARVSDLARHDSDAMQDFDTRLLGNSPWAGTVSGLRHSYVPAIWQGAGAPPRCLLLPTERAGAGSSSTAPQSHGWLADVVLTAGGQRPR